MNNIKEILEFENWSSGELSIIGHHFRNKVIKTLMFSKNANTKNVLLNSYSSMKKKNPDDF